MRTTRKIFWLFFGIEILHLLPLIFGFFTVIVFQLTKTVTAIIPDSLFYFWLKATGLLIWFFGFMLIYIYQREKRNKPINWILGSFLGLIPIAILIYNHRGYGQIHNAYATWIYMPVITIVMFLLIFIKHRKTKITVDE
ncbi:MAG: hypothetical protein HUU32_05460 [Calditrichaceae bacterium]|nr:hypothetical protein [Calditrichia bacterium]NUQ40823.1 hypothetical protein [Calditrichaceae bacterium]